MNRHNSSSSSFEKTIDQISTSFIEEARRSPNLIEDMAAMEKYLAESYSGRAFIELLQNADDALSTEVLVEIADGDLYFANNGRPFDESDLLSICRSGASNKERGSQIGYRGIGFKGATCISHEIIINSNGAFFSFSKSLCARALNAEEDKVPTVRIPFLAKKVDKSVEKKIDALKRCGYTTVFVFQNAARDYFLEELREVSADLFLFLHHVRKCTVQYGGNKIHYSLERKASSQGKKVILHEEDGTSEEWLVIDAKTVSVAFLVKDGTVVPCESADAVFHCFLPTLDKVRYPCKINADFSTDPSRKHLTYDTQTMQAIQEAAKLLFAVLREAVEHCNSDRFRNILSILSSSNSFTHANVELSDTLTSLIVSTPWLKLRNGALITANEYKRLPACFSDADSSILRRQSQVVGNLSLPSEVYKHIDGVDKFLGKYSGAMLDVRELIEVAAEPAEAFNEETRVNVIAASVKEARRNLGQLGNSLLLPEMKVLTSDNKLVPIRVAVAESSELHNDFADALASRLLPDEMSWLKKQTSLPDKAFVSKKKVSKISRPSESAEVPIPIKPHVTKWRDAEHKCMEIERALGNTPRDVSVRNEGYDIESRTPTGETRYIEVKSVKRNWEFSLTNNEYTAASQYGTSYYICLLLEKEDELLVRYINDPLNSATFEKRIRQWEWLCLDFQATELSYDLL